MIPQIRDQLRRLGCFAGGDLNWNSPGLRLGVSKYVRYANLSHAAPNPDQSLLDDMKARRAGLCPPNCSAREVLVGGQCVVKTCPAGAALLRSGRCASKPAAAPVPHEAVAARSARPAPAEPVAKPRPTVREYSDNDPVAQPLQHAASGTGRQGRCAPGHIETPNPSAGPYGFSCAPN